MKEGESRDEGGEGSKRRANVDFEECAETSRYSERRDSKREPKRGEADERASSTTFARSRRVSVEPFSPLSASRVCSMLGYKPEHASITHKRRPIVETARNAEGVFDLPPFFGPPLPGTLTNRAAVHHR